MVLNAVRLHEFPQENPISLPQKAKKGLPIIRQALRHDGELMFPQTYRFENWKLLRAFALPYFLRSTVRLSRVRKPCFFSAG